MKKLIQKIADIEFVRIAIEEQADLTPFKEKPSLEVITGVLLIILGSLLGWPAVAVLGVLAIKFNEPLLAVIGGPLAYGLSFPVFGLGMYFSGAKYTIIFFRWLSRVMVEKLSAWVNPGET
ncbi:hypothetical protein UWK_00147 [Desulfocapsa sulfexigens DSM 10523]|uniref:Uncharacterized protein n=1 Tax=Desulfocapsa sulfexigens (strain DSM 10523 / SB164P1) TaxID=1167006 RepID=M1NA55_DESSD|nr:hypothetical protein [Desulfocapsa sulfexigens]AGF76734.1 hypothetical protein UWK_00147 [Desulfocapsa sulfexigens DSM 10523]